MKLNQFGRLEIYLFNYGNSKCKIINYCRSPRFFLSKKVLALLKTPYYFISVFRPQSYFYFSILVVFTSQEIRVRYVLCSVDELNNFSAFLFCFSIFCFSYFIFVFSFFLNQNCRSKVLVIVSFVCEEDLDGVKLTQSKFMLILDIAL